ncbi:MAG: glycosyltransferase family 8 protein [Chitinophagaceae bacterium]|nr:MAG: glycosyltransferase family 8 protein [Chitinophagaceae bacterium]
MKGAPKINVLGKEEKPNGDSITIVCGADDNFSMPLVVALFSALTNLRPGIVPNIYIIDGGIREKNKLRIEKSFQNTNRDFHLYWVPFDLNKLPSIKETKIISKAAYLRVLIPDLLPASVSKAIYLDCDMIVEADLQALWDMPFASESAMGVQDYCFPFLSSPAAIGNFNELNLADDTPYCNSGLLVINVDYWRKHAFSSKILAYLQSNSERLKHFDQDGINVVIAGNWRLLDPRWNVSLSSVLNFGEGTERTIEEVNYYQGEFKANPYIIHFTSRYKPWHLGLNNKDALVTFYYQQPYRDRFFHYLRKSQWFRGIYFFSWITYRRIVLFSQYKLPRRIKIQLGQSH